MLEVAEVSELCTLELPKGIASQVKPHEKFIVWMDGDTIHFKRMNSPLSVEPPPDDAQMTLEEVNEIVHEVRRNRHKAKV